MAQSPPQYSADGKFYWDGTRWVPVTAPSAPPSAPPGPPGGGGWGRTVAVGIVCLIVGGVCGGLIASSGKSSENQASTSNALTQPSPVASPSPSPRQPVSLSGRGSKVITPLHLGEGNYKVSWSAQGHDNFIVHIVLGDQQQGLVNEIPPSPSSGETLFMSPQEADYTLQIQAPTLTWTITFTPV